MATSASARPGSSSRTAWRTAPASDGRIAGRAQDEEAAREIDERVVDRAVVGASRPVHLTSPTTPTTVVQGQVVQPPLRKRRPSDFLAGEEPVGPGAIDDDDVSRQRLVVEQAAALERETAALKKPGETPTHGQTGWFCPGGVG